jgi:hypothetical protein
MAAEKGQAWASWDKHTQTFQRSIVTSRHRDTATHGARHRDAWRPNRPRCFPPAKV